MNNMSGMVSEIKDLFGTGSGLNLFTILNATHPEDNMIMFDKYFRDRRDFSVEFGYLTRNFIQMIYQYYDDKGEYFNYNQLMMQIACAVIVFCTLLSSAILYFRIDWISHLMLYLWLPVALVSFYYLYYIFSLVRLGETIYTGCLGVGSLLVDKNFKLDASQILQVRNISTKSAIEERAFSSYPIDNFASSFSKCGSGEDTSLGSAELKKDMDRREYVASSWLQAVSSYSYKTPEEEKILFEYMYDLYPYYTNSSKVFDDISITERNLSVSETFYLLNNATNVAPPIPGGESAQKIGGCKAMNDYWAWDPNKCDSDYMYHNKAHLNSTIDQIGEKNCLVIFQWNTTEIQERYTESIFSGCSYTNSTPDDPYSTYAQFAVGTFNQTSIFSESLRSSIASSFDYFSKADKMMTVLSNVRTLLNENIQKETDLVYQMVEQIAIYNQTNNCGFLKGKVKEFSDNFCTGEMQFYD